MNLAKFGLVALAAVVAPQALAQPVYLQTQANFDSSNRFDILTGSTGGYALGGNGPDLSATLVSSGYYDISPLLAGNGGRPYGDIAQSEFQPNGGWVDQYSPVGHFQSIGLVPMVGPIGTIQAAGDSVGFSDIQTGPEAYAAGDYVSQAFGIQFTFSITNNSRTQSEHFTAYDGVQLYTGAPGWSPSTIALPCSASASGGMTEYSASNPQGISVYATDHLADSATQTISASGFVNSGFAVGNMEHFASEDASGMSAFYGYVTDTLAPGQTVQLVVWSAGGSAVNAYPVSSGLGPSSPQTVPEPLSLGLSLGCLGLFVRRKMNSAKKRGLWASASSYELDPFRSMRASAASTTAAPIIHRARRGVVKT